MANSSSSLFETPQQVLQRLQQQRQQSMGGNPLQVQQAVLGNALDAVFGNPEVKRAKAVQAAIERSMVGAPAGEDAMGQEVRRVQAVRDAYASQGDINNASRANQMLLQLEQLRLEQRKLQATTVQEEAATTPEALMRPSLEGVKLAQDIEKPDPTSWYFPRNGTWKAVNEKDPRDVEAARAVGAFPSRADVQAGTAGDLFPKKALAEFGSLAIGTGQFLGELGNLKELILENPRALTVPGKAMAMLNNVRAQAVNTLRNQGISESEITAMEQKAYDQFTKAGVSDAKIRSSLLGLAYARAKSLDPGGRLSNQDIEIAIQMFGASGQGDWRVTVSVLDQLAQQAHDRVQIGSSFLPVDQRSGALEALRMQFERYRNIRGTAKPQPLPGKYKTKDGVEFEILPPR